MKFFEPTRIGPFTRTVGEGSGALIAVPIGWLAFGVGMGLDKALQVGLYPFLLAALLKEALGAALIRSAWTLVRKLRGI